MLKYIHPMGCCEKGGDGELTVVDRFLVCLYRWVPFLRGWIRRRRRLRIFLRNIYRGRERIPVSENDYYRLLKVLREGKKMKRVKPTLLAAFKHLLRKTEVLPVRRVPRDIVTMNSQFTVLTKRQRVIQLQLVYPEKANRAEGQISILSWLGLCLLGKREGERVLHDLSVRKILYQPEDYDDFHL